MGRDNFQDSALILVGHGSTLNAESAGPVFQHAAELRKRKQFAEVREAFWKQEPQVQRVLGEVGCGRVFIVPIFISDGYFSEDVIPRALGFERSAEGNLLRVRIKGSQTLRYTRPVGSHVSMTEVLLARARQAVESAPFPRAPLPNEITLFVCGHGTEQSETSRLAVERQVERIRERNVYGAVHGVFLEEEPRVETCYGMASTRNIVVVPFFISDGMHTREDIPVLLGEPKRIVQQRLGAGQPTWRNPTEKKGKLVWYSSSIGTEPQIADVILELVREAARG